MSISARQRNQYAFGRTVYGFVLMVFSILFLLLFLFFAFVPDSLLADWGITYYPTKHWFIVVPATLVFCVFFFLLVIHPWMNFSITAPLHSINLVRDSNTRHMDDISGDQPYINNQRRSRIPPVSDMRIQDVCRKFYYDESLIKND